MKNEKDNLIDTVFPKEDGSKQDKSRERKMLKTWSKVAPFFTLFVMILLIWAFGALGHGKAMDVNVEETLEGTLLKYEQVKVKANKTALVQDFKKELEKNKY